ncbi:Transmembrane protein 41A, partial [Geodia barretti]
RELVGVLVTFAAATVPLYALAASLLRNGPPLSFPSDMDQLRSLASQLERLREEHYGRVLCVFSAAYLYKQTFAIPGSVFLLHSSKGTELLLVLLSLRLFPMSPNWLLNLSSPLLGVPLHLFFISVLFGLLPYNFLCVQSGLMLAELRGVAILDPASISLLVLGTVLLLATGLGMRYFHSRLEQTRTSR